MLLTAAFTELPVLGVTYHGRDQEQLYCPIASVVKRKRGLQGCLGLITQ